MAQALRALPPNPVLAATAKRSGFLYAAAFVILALWGNAPDGAEALILLPPLFLWCLGPAVGAALLVKAARTRAGQWTFLFAEGAIFASMAWTIASALIEQDPWAGLRVIYFAFLQYCALAAYWVLAALLGWRAREGWR